MIYHPSFTPTTERLREIVESPERDFPHTAMDTDLSNFRDRGSPWHWHECFEFVHVREGRALLRTPQGEALLGPGDGCFVNANVLHSVQVAPGEAAGRLRVHLFRRELIAGTGLVGRRYVAPIENCAALERVILRYDEAADRAILAELDAAFAAAEADDAGHELEIAAHLALAWRRLFDRVANELSGGSGVREENSRVKEMLSFIHGHYREDLSVAEIAASAGVSERECFRCFASVLDTTPTRYLARHRIAEAARLLAETNRSVAQIAEDCGFSGASYFGKVFRAAMGCAPGEYRRQPSFERESGSDA